MRTFSTGAHRRPGFKAGERIRRVKPEKDGPGRLTDDDEAVTGVVLSAGEKNCIWVRRGRGHHLLRG